MIRNTVSGDAWLKHGDGKVWLHVFSQCTCMLIYLSCRAAAAWRPAVYFCIHCDQIAFWGNHLTSFWQHFDKRSTSVSAMISGCVMLLLGGQVRPVQRNREERAWRAGTEFQAPHCSWNFKNFKRSDPNSETSNLMNSLRIIQEDLGIFQTVTLQDYNNSLTILFYVGFLQTLDSGENLGTLLWLTENCRDYISKKVDE